MTKTEAFLRKLAKKSNVWSLTKVEEIELISIISEELFLVPKELETMVISLASTKAMLIKKNKVNDVLIYSFANSILGDILLNHDNFYLKANEEISSNLPLLKEYNSKSTIDNKFYKFYDFVKAKIEYLDNSNSKKVS